MRTQQDYIFGYEVYQDPGCPWTPQIRERGAVCRAYVPTMREH